MAECSSLYDIETNVNLIIRLKERLINLIGLGIVEILILIYDVDVNIDGVHTQQMWIALYTHKSHMQHNILKWCILNVLFNVIW